MVVQELGGPKLFLSCAITPKLRRGSAEGGDVALERIVGPHCGSDLVLYVVPTGAQKNAPDDGSSKLGGNHRCSNYRRTPSSPSSVPMITHSTASRRGGKERGRP